MFHVIEITDLSSPELDIYARLKENQLFNLYQPKPGLFIAESPVVIQRALSAGYEPVSLLAEKQQLSTIPEKIFSGYPDIPVYTADTDILTRLTGFHLTRGVLCAMRRRPLPALEAVCQNARRIAVLEDIVNPTNIGAIFRSAAALGIDAVLLTAGCSDPLYRRSIRVSMGTVFQVPWTVLSKDISWPETGMKLLHQLDFKTAAMALCEASIAISDPRLTSEKHLAIILGTEGDGLAESTIASCDYTVRIPMAHGVDSLNVAAASAVAFWELTK